MRAVLAICAAALLPGACQSPQDRMEEHYQSGLELMAKGELQKAALEFRNVLQIDEDHVGALSGLSRYQENAQDWRGMAATLQKIADIDPDHVEAREQLCRMMLLAGALDEARANCDRALELEPDRASLLSLKAGIEWRGGNAGQAVALARRAIGIDPRNVDAIVILAADRLAGDAPAEALELVDDGLRSQPTSESLLLFRIQILERLDRGEDIIAALRELIAAYPARAGYKVALSNYYSSTNRMGEAEDLLRELARDDPENVQAALEVVRFLARTKGPEAAEAELRSLAAAHPGISEYGLGLASALWNRGERDRAKQIIQDLIAGSEAEAASAARLQLARILVSEQKIADARALIDEVIGADARNVDALVLRAALKREDGLLDDAVTDLRTALGDEPNHVPALLSLGQIHESKGAVELAEQRFAEAARAGNFAPAAARPYVEFLLRRGRADQAEQVARQILQLSPRDVPSLTLLAQILLNRQDWERAQEIAELLRAEQQVTVSNQVLAAALSGQQKFDESISVLRSVMREAPGEPNTLASLISVHVRAGKTEQAIELLNEILATSPGRIDAIVLLGSVREVRKEDEEAAKFYRRAIELAPDNPMGYRALAMLQVRQGSVDAALDTASTGLERTPPDLNLRLLRAGLYERAGEIDRAIEDYEAMYSQQPESLVVINNLASLLAEHRSDEESLARAQNLASRLQSLDVPQFKDTLAWVHYRFGRYVPAIALLREAASAPAPLPIYHYHLGEVYRARGELDLAREQYRAALELSGDFAQADAARRTLAELSEAARVPAQ